MLMNSVGQQYVHSCCVVWGLRWKTQTGAGLMLEVVHSFIWRSMPTVVCEPRASLCGLTRVFSQGDKWILRVRWGCIPSLPHSIHGGIHKASPNFQGRDKRAHLLTDKRQGLQEHVGLWTLL